MKKALQNRINLANKYIEFAIKHDIMGEDYFGGTYPVFMIFRNPIQVSPAGRVVTVSWHGAYSPEFLNDPFLLRGDKDYALHTEKYHPNTSWSEEELRYTINGIIRGIKKGAKDDGWILSHKGQSFSAQRANPSDTFIQDAFEEIDKDGTEGAFTRYVAANYYGENTPAKREAVAQDIVKKYKAWSKKGKKGKAPFSLRTYRRAIFYLNIQKN